MKKINLGSGPSGIQGWENYDWGILPMLSKLPAATEVLISLGLLSDYYRGKWPSITLVDLRGRFPAANETVDYIYCSQVLEHFEWQEAIHILNESFRLLKPGGVMRISVPDIDKMISKYLEEKSLDALSVANNLNVIWWGLEKHKISPSLINKFKGLFIRDHKWHYSFASISNLIHTSKFENSNIKKLDYRVGECPDINVLDLEIHRDHSMYLEIYKSV